MILSLSKQVHLRGSCRPLATIHLSQPVITQSTRVQADIDLNPGYAKKHFYRLIIHNYCDGKGWKTLLFDKDMWKYKKDMWKYPFHEKGVNLFDNQYHGYRWPADAKRQIISRHVLLFLIIICSDAWR